LREMFGTEGLLLGYAAFLASFVSVLMAGYAVFALQTVRSEALQGRGDLVLATPVGRSRWVGWHAVVVTAAVLLISVLTGLSTGVAAAAVTRNWAVLGDALAAHLALLPAVLLVLALGTALLGWLPRALAPVGWAVVALCAVVNFFGELLQLPDWFTALAPFSHLAQVPVEGFDLAPFLVLTLL